ncbi:hypothetical protein KM043_007907 [Ampulex compressa]|nr:hypothetical protein KM043_007907 [Ampulex compressa]
MFSIAGYRLEHMFDEVQLISNSEKKAVIHQRILNAVTQQLNIVKGTNLAMSCYTISFAVQFFVIVLAIATTLVNIRNGLASRNHILFRTLEQTL